MATVIDIHTHVFPDQLAPSAIARFEDVGTVKAFYDGTVAGLVGVMDLAGIDIAVTQAVATKPSQVRSINDWTASTATHRIIPFGAMHPDVEDPWAEISHAHALGLRGIKMHPEFQRFSPDEPRVRPILDAALEFGMIVFMHAGEDITLDTLHGTPGAFSRMLDAYPDLTVVLAHMGGWQQWDGVLRELIGRHDFWIDTAFTLGHLPDERFVELVRAHGADKVLFGSDGPWADPADEIARLGRLGFAPPELDGILGENAERLLGL